MADNASKSVAKAVGVGSVAMRTAMPGEFVGTTLDMGATMTLLRFHAARTQESKACGSCSSESSYLADKSGLNSAQDSRACILKRGVLIRNCFNRKQHQL